MTVNESRPTGIIYQNYAEFARALYETGMLSDPWFDGRERFRMRGVLLSPQTAKALIRAAERVAILHQELIEILCQDPELVDQFYHLTPWQEAMWESSGGLWHGMARADLFICEDGRVVCCELNSDTPSGQPEAVVLNQLLAPMHGLVDDPNIHMGESYIRMLQESQAKRTTDPLHTVGIIYPTELTEDLGMITLIRRWLEAAGITVVAGSPYNLRRTDVGLEVLGKRVDLIIRHYKTDWWGERLPVWQDAPEYNDPLPLYQPLAALLSAEMAGEVTVVNPFGAVITQNKFSLAFFWEEMARFSPRACRWIREYIPETYRMASLSREQLRAERTAWVLKSDYGCEGAETICGAFVSDEIWCKSVETALPEHFVAQRFFRVQPDDAGDLINYGVYLMGGSATGFFTRLSRESTDYRAVTVPTFISREE
ncbi:MAG: glutathionylspermidine synthase family protein [Acidobacteriota bacterium]